MKNKKKAFTVVEIVVSLSIIVIVLALCSTLILMVSNISKKQNYEYECQIDYKEASLVLDEFKNTYSTYQYTLFDVSDNHITIKENENTYQINYDSNLNKLTAQILNHETNEIVLREVNFKHLINILFVAQDNNVKCTFEFESFHSYSSLLIFGAN